MAITLDGLLIRPTSVADPQSILRISWNSTPLVEDVAISEEIKWSDSLVFFGIVGIVRLFRGSCQLNQYDVCELLNLCQVPTFLLLLHDPE